MRMHGRNSRIGNPRAAGRFGVFIAISAAALLLAAPAAIAQQTRLSIEQISSAPYPFDMVAAPAGGAVAWIFNERGARNLWIAEPISGGRYAARAITRNTADNGVDLSDLRFADGGRALVYVRGGDNGGRVAVNPTSDPLGPRAGEVWITSITSPQPRRLAEGHAPAPSPDGTQVAFLRGGQPFRIAAGGGDAAPLFRDRGQVSNLKWSPDGHQILFVSNRGTHSLIGVYDLAAGKIIWIAPGVDKDIHPVWSPDGRRVAFVRTPAGETRTQGLNRVAITPWEIWVADTQTGEGSRVWKAKSGLGSRFWALFNSEESLLWAAGDTLVFPWEDAGWANLYAVPAAGGDARALTTGESEVFAARLSPDRTRVIYASNFGDIDRRHIWETAVAGGSPRQLSKSKGIEDFPVVTVDNQVFALRGDARAPLRPVRLRDGATEDLAAEAIPKTFPADRLVEPQLVTFTAADGVTVHGQLFVPRNLKGRAPALLFTHGGPTNRQTFAAWDSFETHSHLYEANQFLAANGYVVLSMNYRGGAGYGLKFREAENFGANGASELNDIVGAARYLQQRPEVDAKRLGVWGGSYGGRMTSLAMARAPEFWVAGVDYAGLHDMSRFYPGLETPEEIKRAYDSSAIAHVDTWRAPVKLIVGDGDALTPDTIELAAALRRRKVEVETMMIPDEVHFLLRHQSWSRVFQATKDYLDRHLKP